MISGGLQARDETVGLPAHRSNRAGQLRQGCQEQNVASYEVQTICAQWCQEVGRDQVRTMRFSSRRVWYGICDIGLKRQAQQTVCSQWCKGVGTWFPTK